MDRIELLILDAHGVILTNPFRAFLGEIAAAAGLAPAEVRRRWRDELHVPAWCGEITDERLWSHLTGGALGPAECATRLERRYALGPAAPHLERWRRHVPIWVLSNHRARWLRPRLERMRVAPHVDRTLVSDELGVMKPDAAAFEPVLAHLTRPSNGLVVDDQLRNIETARCLGLQAVHAQPAHDWVRRIDRMLATPTSSSVDQAS